jgi:hypothetical protein
MYAEDTKTGNGAAAADDFCVVPLCIELCPFAETDDSPPTHHNPHANVVCETLERVDELTLIPSRLKDSRQEPHDAGTSQQVIDNTTVTATEEEEAAREQEEEDSWRRRSLRGAQSKTSSSRTYASSCSAPIPTKTMKTPTLTHRASTPTTIPVRTQKTTR